MSNRLVQLFKVSAAGALLVAATGCAAPGDNSPLFEVLVDNNHCPFESEQLRLISNSKELKKLVQQFNAENQWSGRPIMIGQSAPTEKILNTAILSQLNSIDFTSQSVVLVARGSQPNPGYSLSQTSSQARIEDGQLYLPVRYDSPDPGRMYPQVVVSPCLLGLLHTAQPVDDLLVKP